MSGRDALVSVEVGEDQHGAWERDLARGDGDRPIVLLVDDNADDRYAARRALDGAGFLIWEEQTGAGGLTRAGDGPDVIILDVNLPDTNGFEVCRRLKDDPRTTHIPILHLSGVHVDVAARVHGLDSGADGYLVQPVESAVLLATVNALLRVRRAEDGLRRSLAETRLVARLSAAFADALKPEHVFDVLAEHSCRHLGAVAVSLQLPGQADMPHLTHSADATGDAVRSSAGAHVATTVPVSAYGRHLGTLHFVHPHGLGAGRLRQLADLGERCGQALERAVLYTEQHDIATTLQASFLPRRLPDIPGLVVGARYESGTAGMSVGGDFYDVFEAPDGWIAVIGDVCGKGAQAAALTSLARHTIRAEARHDGRPRVILEALNRAVSDDQDDELQLLTAVCCLLREDDEGFVASIATGGHPPPLILRQDGAVEAIEQGGPLLGAQTGLDFHQIDVRLAAGDALVLYTDGVLEARCAGEQFGSARLAAVLATPGATGRGPQPLADEVLHAVHAHADHVGDDIAVLVLQVT